MKSSDKHCSMKKKLAMSAMIVFCSACHRNGNNALAQIAISESISCPPPESQQVPQIWQLSLQEVMASFLRIVLY